MQVVGVLFSLATAVCLGSNGCVATDCPSAAQRANGRCVPRDAGSANAHKARTRAPDAAVGLGRDGDAASLDEDSSAGRDSDAATAATLDAASEPDAATDASLGDGAPTGPDPGPCDGGRATRCFWDADGDGYAASTAHVEIECADSCPAGSTSVEPAGADIDCDDKYAGAHPSADEDCNGMDDDCDGTIDEGASTTCALDHATASCDQGACVIESCSNGYDSCDGNQSNGCERSLSATDSCGACGVACDARASCAQPAAGGATRVCECNPPLAGDGSSCLGFGSLTLGTSNGVGYLCGLRPDGRVECFGSNAPSHGSSDLFSQIAAGKAFICGIRKDDAHAIECFGDDNSHGQIGTGTITSSGPEFVQVVTGNFHACALLADGTARCWGGKNVSGDSTMYDYGQAIVPSSLQGTFHQLSAGAFHTCGLARDGFAVCWGAGKTRTCALGSNNCTTDDYGQSAAPANEHFIQVSAGLLHSCGLRADGSVLCWGAGTSTTTNAGIDLGQALGKTGPYALISAGLTQTCGVTDQHKVDCWGTAPALDGAGNVSRVYAGQLLTCELYTDDTAKCSSSAVTLDNLPWLQAL